MCHVSPERSQKTCNKIVRFDHFKFDRYMTPPSATATTINMSRMIIMMVAWWTMLSTTTTTACRCVIEPTLDIMLQEENVSIFHGMIVPSRSSASNDSSHEYTVWIQKVYKHGGSNPSESGINPPPPYSPPPLRLRAYSTMTIVSPRNSCGVSLSLSLFRTFLFTGVVLYPDNNNNNRTRTLQEKDAVLSSFPRNTTTATTGTLSNPHRYQPLRRTASTKVVAATAFSMKVDVCSNYIKPWRTVSRAELMEYHMHR